nr:MAG TPA: hypothetical protein [Caudoviricetes sp.]
MIIKPCNHFIQFFLCVTLSFFGHIIFPVINDVYI